MREFDLVIIGASFAGLVCARTAELRGLSTVIIEAKPDPGARVHTTGILVKEADEEIDTPPHLTRVIHGVRLYAPNLQSIDLFAPGYYFLTTDTDGLLRWLAQQARGAGAELVCGKRLARAERQGQLIALPEFGLRARFLVGADGARSTVARLFDLGRNRRFLIGLEREYGDLPGADPRFLHCFLDTQLAPGYLAWVAPAPGLFQAGLATNSGGRPDLARFLAHADGIFGFSRSTIVERRSGLIPLGGPVRPSGAANVLLIGDAAGHVSPLTGGGIRLAFPYGRRAAQLIADHLMRLGPAPHQALAREMPSIGRKLALRRVIELGPPNWLYDLTISTPWMRWFARQVYFHRQAESGERLTDFEKRVNAPAGPHREEESIG